MDVCPTCKKKINYKDKFCGECGSEITIVNKNENISKIDPHLQELKKQNNYLRSIKNNIQFFFWITIFSIILYLFIYIRISNL